MRLVAARMNLSSSVGNFESNRRHQIGPGGYPPCLHYLVSSIESLFSIDCSTHREQHSGSLVDAAVDRARSLNILVHVDCAQIPGTP